MKNWYTQNEVAEILGVSKATVYHYAKQGKIKKIPDPHRIHREARYEKEEVDIIAAERSQHPTGLRPSDVAKELGMSTQSVLNYIRQGIIQAMEVPYGDERTYYVISEESLLAAKEQFKKRSDRIRKTEYYDTQLDVALFQLFQSPHNHMPARVELNEENEWGFYLPHYQKWLSYEEGQVRYDLKPAYSIHQDLLEHKGYVYFEIPFGADPLYPFIDYLYSVWGIENVGIRKQERTVYISIKAGEKPFINNPFTLEQLRSYLKEGILDMSDDLLILRSAYRKTSLDLPIDLLDTVKKITDDQKISISEWIEDAIRRAIRQLQEGDEAK